MAARRSTRWWDEPAEEVGRAVAHAARACDDLTTDRQQTALEAMCLYGDVPTWASRRTSDSGAMGHNVIAAAVDTLVAEMTQTMPRPMVAPVGGTWLDARRCRKLTRYLDAQVDLLELRDIALDWIRDAAIAGLGALHVYEEGGEPRLERTWPGHLLLDDTACVDVPPPAFYARRPLERSRAQALYPEQASELAASTGDRARHSWVWALDPREDVIELLEAWHPPSAPGAGDGRHTITTWDGVTLADEPEWDGVRNRLVFLRAVKPLVGFWGESLVMRARPAQLELNKLLRRVQESMHLVSVPRVFVQRQAGINVGDLTNDIGIVVEYDGAPPTILTPSAMPPDVYAHIERLARWVFDQVGVSQLAAQSQKPAGLNSGVALRTYQNVQSRRFVNLQRAVETGFCDVARALLEMEASLAKDDPSREVVYRRGGRVVRIDWSDMSIEGQSYVVKVMPASALPQEPAARLQALQEMRADGRIDADTFWAMADVPDFEGIRDRMVAPTENLLQKFDLMLESGEYIGPTAFEDLQRGLHLCAVTLQQAELEGVDEERLELLRQWHATATRLLGLANEPSPPPAGLPLPAPPEAGMPPMPPPMPPAAPQQGAPLPN